MLESEEQQEGLVVVEGEKVLKSCQSRERSDVI
jgi:hypothetical protein